MYSKQLESLIKAAMTDGVLTESEREILYKKADAEGIDRAEFDMVLNARIFEAQQEAEVREKKAAAKRAKEERDELAEKNREEELAQARAKAEAEKAKLTKHGKTRKCPVCGALVPAVAAVCPECGYEFSGLEANATTLRLAEKLENATEWDKAQIISTIAIPKSKDDLFEFLILMRTQCENLDIPHTIDQNRAKEVQNRIDICKAYVTKHKECMMKAKLLFPNDATFAQLTADNDAFYKQIKKKILIASLISGPLGFLGLFVLLFGGIGGFIYFMANR